MFALTGASLRHNRIVTDLVMDLANQLEGTRCEVLPGDLRLHVEAVGLYTCSDVTVGCGPPHLEDEHCWSVRRAENRALSPK